jgi:hypothetical protein
MSLNRWVNRIRKKRKEGNVKRVLFYDLNSQYPNAMLLNLQVGVGDKLRLISLSTDKLKDCFGIVYA